MLTLYTREELTSLKAGTRLAPDEEAREAVRIAVREHGAAGEVNLRRKDGSIIRTAYWVIETKAALMPYYPSLLMAPGARAMADGACVNRPK